MTTASLIATLEPVVASLLAMLVWSERFSLLGYVAAVVLLAGMYLGSTADGQEHRKKGEL